MQEETRSGAVLGRMTLPPKVGTSRCDVPARVPAGGTIGPTWLTSTFVPSPDATLGDGDGAARHPYQGACRYLGNKPLRCASVLTFLAVLILSGRALGDSITLVPDADTSLFANFPDNNLGASASLVAGGNGAGLPGRALLHFDVAGQVPSNALIQSVALTVNVVMAPGAGGVNSMFDLHRVLAGWVEGAGTGNTGSPANDGEPTWNDRVYPSLAWTTPGGAVSNDFSATVSSTMLINGLGGYTFASTSNLVADVQQWLLNPATNYGWILISESEDAPFTARRFGAREDPINTSVLQIQYARPSAPEFQWIKPIVGGIQLGFIVAAEQPYTVQYRDSPGVAGWMTLTNIVPQATATNVIVTDSVTASAQRYYRVGAF